MTIKLVSSNDNPTPAVEAVEAAKDDGKPGFANVVAIADARSEKTGEACDWTPRDALLTMLHEIDSGECNPDTLIICHGNTSDGAISVKYYVSSPSAIATAGVMQLAMSRMVGE